MLATSLPKRFTQIGLIILALGAVGGLSIVKRAPMQPAMQPDDVTNERTLQAISFEPQNIARLLKTAPPTSDVDGRAIEELFETAQQYMMEGSYERASAAYQRVLAIDNLNAFAHAEFARLLMEVFGEYRQAEEHLFTAALLDPKDLSTINDLFQLYLSNSSLQHLAFARVEELQTLHQTAERLQQAAAKFWQAQGETDRAIASLDRIADTAANAPEVYHQLGSLYASQQRWGEAEEAYQRAIALYRAEGDHRTGVSSDVATLFEIERVAIDRAATLIELQEYKRARELLKGIHVSDVHRKVALEMLSSLQSGG